MAISTEKAGSTGNHHYQRWLTALHMVVIWRYVILSTVLKAKRGYDIITGVFAH